MRTIGRGWLRRLSPVLAAGLLGLTGIGLTAGPAAADANLSVALAVTSSLPGAAANTMYVGQSTNYALTVTAGPSGLTGVSFTDTLPADVTYNAVSGAGWSCSVAANPIPATTSTLTCTQANAMAASATSTATVTLALSKATVLTSVTLNPTATTGTTGTPPGATGTLASPANIPVLPDADLALTKTVNPPPAAGQVSYDLKVTNLGPSAAAAPIAISDTLPAGLTFVSGSGTGWTCTASPPPPPPAGNGPSVTCTNMIDLPASAGANDPAAISTVTIIAGVPAGNNGRLTTAASVTSPTFDPNPTNNTALAPQGVVPYGTAADPGPCGTPSAGSPAVRTCKLVAAPGTVTVPGFAAPIPIWGFAMDPGSGTPAGTVPGPTLIANEGETLHLVVRNILPTHAGDQNLLAVNIPGITTSHPDPTGVPSGSSTSATSSSYSWPNLRPGTYLYEAGPTTNGARQVAMGLSGLLVVRPKGFTPATMTLFDPPVAPPTGNACTNSNGSSQFTAETLVQVNELSSEFHNNPFGSTMVPGGGNGPVNSVFTPGANNPGGSPDRAVYAPDVFLINGQSYPNTAITPVGGTDCVALHYADMGMLEKSFGVLGRRQIVMADDSNALAHPQNLATKYLNPGQEVDTVVDMTGTTAGTQFPVMDFGHHLHNGSGSPNNATAASNTGMTLGGQLALLQVSGTQPTAANPAIDLVGLNQNTVAMSKGGTITPAQLTMTARGMARAPGTSIAGGEYTIDNIVLPGTAPGGQTISAGGIATIPTSSLSALSNGDHIIWARVRDSAGNWSDPPTGVVFTFDRVPAGTNQAGGPLVSNLSLDPSITNGSTSNKTPGTPDPTTGVPALSADMVIDGTATPPLPDWTISSFSWSIDGGASTSVPVSSSPGSPVEITTTIPQATLQSLSGDAQHTVIVTATETQGASTRTGNPVTVTFIKAITGPAASIADITPSPAGPASDHTANLNYFPSVRIRGALTDNLTQVVAGEMWFLPVVNGNPVGLTGSKPIPDGQGVQVTPDSGQWTTPTGKSAQFFVDIPVAEFNALPQGIVRIYVHGKDKAGNWNQSYATADLVLDKTPPLILDHTSAPAQTDPVVSRPSPGHYTLDFWAQDPATTPPGCNTNCGIPETSKVTAVEWQISYGTVVDNPAANDFTVYLGGPGGPGGANLPAATNGPVELPIDISGGPQPYPAGAQAVFRVRDGAGNWTDWRTVTIP